MQIFGPFRVSTTQPTTGAQRTSPAPSQPVKTPNQPVDQLDLSSDSPEINAASKADAGTINGIRFEKVAEIRRQIADGIYDTDEKLDAALERMLDEIA